MLIKNPYTRPECEFEDTAPLSVVCASPEDGGTEDVGYDDWTTP